MLFVFSKTKVQYEIMNMLRESLKDRLCTIRWRANGLEPKYAKWPRIDSKKKMNSQKNRLLAKMATCHLGEIILEWTQTYLI